MTSSTPAALLAILGLAGGWAAYRLGAGCDAAAAPAATEPMRPYRAVPASGQRAAERGFPAAAGEAADSAPAELRMRNPLQPLLDAAVNALPEHLATSAPSTAASADHASAELRAVAQFVVDAVNRANGAAAGLGLVAVESALKAVDPYKTVRYELVLNAFSTRLTMAARVAATVVVAPGGKAYLARATAEGGAVSPQPGSGGGGGGVEGSLGPAAEGDYAAFAPVV